MELHERFYLNIKNYLILQVILYTSYQIYSFSKKKGIMVGPEAADCRLLLITLYGCSVMSQNI